MTATAAGSALWATGVDGDGERARIAAALAASPYRGADDVVVLARGESGVLTPADLYA